MPSVPKRLIYAWLLLPWLVGCQGRSDPTATATPSAAGTAASAFPFEMVIDAINGILYSANIRAGVYALR